MDHIEVKHLWEDESMIEVRFSVIAIDMNAAIQFYTTRESLKELANAMNDVSTYKEKHLLWTEGEDVENSYRYVNIEISRFDIRGKIQLDFVFDSKGKKPYRQRNEFSLLVEAGSLEQFASRLDNLACGITKEISGVSIVGF